AAARAPSTVGPSQPTEGCAATPMGLSTTTRSSSWYTIRRALTGVSVTVIGSRACHWTSSHAPPTRRSDLCATTPSMVTPPDSATSAAKVREKPRSFASPASTRSPASPSGTARLRDSTGLLRALGGRGNGHLVDSVSVEAHSQDGQQDKESHADHDGAVGDVENRREVDDLDEVHDVTL